MAAFWDFACTLYRRDGVERACLWLQDNAGVDVTALLLCCWLGQTYGAVPPRHSAALLADADTWSRQLIAPLRRARRWYRDQPEPMRDATLYRQLKDVELAAEKTLMLHLEARARQLLGAPPDSGAGRTADARGLVDIYLARAAITLDPHAAERVTWILAASKGAV